MQTASPPLQTLDILHLEDNQADQAIFQEYLACTQFSTSNVKVIEKIQQLISLKLDDYVPELIVLDLNLPDSKGINTLQFVKNYYPSVPIMVLNGVDSENFGVDYIPSEIEKALLKSLQNEDILEQIIYSVINESDKAKQATEDEPKSKLLIEAMFELLFDGDGFDPEKFEAEQEKAWDDLLLSGLEFDITELGSEEELLEIFQEFPKLSDKVKEIYGNKPNSNS